MTGVIVLNTDNTALHTVSVQHAIRMLVREVAIVEEAHADRKIGPYPWPLVLRLIRYVKTTFLYARSPAWSKRGVLRRDHHRCAYCEGSADTVDHLLPQSRGGLNTWLNTVAACTRCNNHKANRTPAEAGLRLAWLPSFPPGVRPTIAGTEPTELTDPDEPGAERAPSEGETEKPSSEGDTEKPSSEGETERPWWDDDRLPWKGKPTRSDLGCWVGFSLIGIYGLVLLPFRPLLISANPYLLAALGGSRTSAVTIGALYATGVGFWPLGLLLGTFGAVKFDWLYWWAGKLWGRGLIELIAGRSPRAARHAARAERLAGRFGPLAMVLTYILPLPAGVIYASVAAAGMRLRTFLAIDIATAVVTRGIFIYLGYRIGEPAVRVIEVIGRYSWYLSIALLLVVFYNLWRQSRARKSRTTRTAENLG